MVTKKSLKWFCLCLIALSTSLLDAKLSSYNLTISDSHRFVWFRVAKVGTRSILYVLNEHHVPLDVNDYEILYNPKDYQGYFKFAFVRNPWDRVVSAYCNKVLTKGHPAFKECFDKGFEYFVDFIASKDLRHADAHIRLQTSLIPVDEMDFIGRLENFDEDLNHVMEKIGIEEVAIPRNNPSEHEHYSHYYTARTKRIIAEKYKRDIKVFGYKFDQQ